MAMAGSLFTLLRQARLFWPSMFMAQEQQTSLQARESESDSAGDA
jgi:hypothetical protein